MIRKSMLAVVFGGMVVIASSCGNKTAAPAGPAAANSPTGSSTSSSNTQPAEIVVTGKWEQVGKDGEWKGTVDMVGMDGFLWSVEPDGSGNYTQVGDKGSFTSLKHLEGMDHMLWTVEGDTLYKTDPKTGKWERSGEGGGWGRTVAMAALNGILYSIEPDGSLWKTDKSGNDTLVDKGGFKGCTELAAMDGKLWTIENGTLYKTEPTTLKWEQVGKEGDFANVTAIAAGDKFLWLIDKEGTLYKVDQNGTRTMLGEKGSYGQTSILTTLSGKLWTVEAGSLYKTS